MTDLAGQVAVVTGAAVAAAAAAVRDGRFSVFTRAGSGARVEARLRPVLDALDDPRVY